MDEIASRLKIVPLSQCLAHEGILPDWAGEIAGNIKNQGILKHPIIATYQKPYHILLDGMHRYAALKKLEVRDILIYEIDYFHPAIVLEGWDIVAFRPLGTTKLAEELFQKSEGFQHEKTVDLKAAQKEVLERKTLLVLGDKGGPPLAIRKRIERKENLVETLCQVTDRLDRVLARRDLRPLYVDNNRSLEAFESDHAKSIVLRPQFTKQEVIDRTLGKKLFPPKSTRHLIPGRPLRVDLDLSILHADIALEEKNRILKDYLNWCYENNRVRFYPESVVVFAD